jgi:hypothetical protein
MQNPLMPAKRASCCARYDAVVGAVLRELRKRQGQNLKITAERGGLALSSLSQYEFGVMAIPVWVLHQWAPAVGAEPWVVLEAADAIVEENAAFLTVVPRCKAKSSTAVLKRLAPAFMSGLVRDWYLRQDQASGVCANG